MNSVFYEHLKEIVEEDRIQLEEPLDAHTTFRVGGPAQYFVRPVSTEEIAEMIKYFNLIEKDYYILGNGSNLLVGDKGYRGVVIQLFQQFDQIRVEGNQIFCQAGALLSKVASVALEAGLTGFEFASGIPGTIGGALVMNAGAYGGEMKDVIISATVMDSDGEVMVLDKKQLELGYRTSIIAEKGYIVLDALMQFSAGSQQQIKSKIAELATCRREKQPLEYPSAGSTFKRPSGYFAAKLISDAGLKGYKVGGAMVSMKHAGFVVNCDHATAADIIQITDDVRAEVKKQYDVQLELEVKKLGF